MSSIGQSGLNLTRPSVVRLPGPRVRFKGEETPPEPQASQPAPAPQATPPAPPKKRSLKRALHLLLASIVGAGSATGVGVVQQNRLHDSFQTQLTQVQRGNQTALDELVRANRRITQDITGAIVPVDTITQVAKAGVRIESASGLGSGTFFRDNNNRLYILTNHHVVDDGGVNGRFKVRLYSGSDDANTEVEAEVVKLSNGSSVQSPFATGKDLAVLRVIEYPDRPAFEPPHALTPGNFRDLEKEPLRAGEAVFAVGTPQGLTDAVSRGVVSNAHRNVRWNPQVISIQIDAPINPGNSGGALYDSQGRLIGVVNSSLIRSGADGLSFAINIESVKKFLNENSIPVSREQAS